MYRSKNSKSSQRDGDNEQYDVDSQGSPAGISVPVYGSAASMDPARNPRHQMLRASPAAIDSPPARSNFCPSPWDSKSSSGSSYSSSTPGIEWQQHNQPPFHSQHSVPHQANPVPAVDGKIGDFRSLCVTFPDYSVTQLQAILEESGNDFDRAVDTILLKRWTDDQVKAPDIGYNTSSDSFNFGSSYLNNTYERQLPAMNHPSNHLQPPLAQNGYGCYPATHYYNSNNVMASSYAQHSVQPPSPQTQYPPQVLPQSHHQPTMTGASSLEQHHQYNGTTYVSNPDGTTACSYYGSPSTNQTTYSTFPSTPTAQHANSLYNPLPKSLSHNPPNGSSGYPHNHTGTKNGQSQYASPRGNRSDHSSTYQDLSAKSANTFTGPRSFAATVVSQSHSTPTHQSLTETMLNQVSSPVSSHGETYQQLIADDPLPLNEAMAVPIKRKRGRPKKVPGSPPVKRTIKKVAQESTQENMTNDQTVTTSAIFKVPQAVNDLPVSTSPSSSLPYAQVNGRNHDSSAHDTSSWSISSPPQTDTTLNSSPSSSLSSPTSVSSGSQVQPPSNDSCTSSDLQPDLVITKTNDQPLTTTNSTKSNQDLNDRTTKLDSSRNLSRSVDEDQLISKNSDVKSDDHSLAKSKSNRDSGVQGPVRRPVTRSSAHRFASV